MNKSTLEVIDSVIRILGSVSLGCLISLAIQKCKRK